ncbi:glutamate synthase [Candidatus Soleaferrea massiliensis]|uniref:GltB/FmdC/FwdC-like GXGXG domain-containing protein n=1 Tax=Candidatus Soleaferrea massiliensis TaxID=1470354 RepID=UPI000590DE72|nr:glutamate synthase [Candidatus Soleaferrea massiliensis]
MKITAGNMHFQKLNEQIRSCADASIEIENCLGQRYIGSGLSGKKITISGTPGNALGAYLDGSVIEVHGNAQEATGDTMNAGAIYIHGSSGDATGYAMRGGKIYVAGNTGYRAGIHMKAYRDKKPVLVVGGAAGSFLGEYQAGGIIVVLGLTLHGEPPVGFFCGTGMHGGKIYLRCHTPPKDLPKQVVCRKAAQDDKKEILPYLTEFCDKFGKDLQKLMSDIFYVCTPDTKNPYKQLYTAN